MIGLGDLVKLNDKAVKRNNNIFSKDMLFVVCEIKKELFDKNRTLYLGLQGDLKSFYCLPEDEVDLVRPVEWAES